jgi:hypothetical protein
MRRNRAIRVAVGLWLALPAASAVAATNVPEVVAATYHEFSLPAPTPESAVICHGFGCRYRVIIGFSAGDRAALTRIMATGRRSAEAERAAVGHAGAWFDKRIAPQAGTKGHVARAGVSHMYDRGQFDCIDSSRNTTALLLVLAEMKLLRHHSVDVPVARGHFFDTRPPHVTAVLTENDGGKQWAVDSWTRAYGQAPEIMPLSRWKTLD